MTLFAPEADAAPDTLPVAWVAAMARPLLRIAVLSALMNVAFLAGPFYVAIVCDQVNDHRGATALLWPTAWLLVACGVVAALMQARRRSAARIVEQAQDRLATALMRGIVGPLAGSARPPSWLVAHDVDLLRHAVTAPALLAVADLAMAPLNLLVIALLHWGLFVLTMGCGSGLAVLEIAADRAAAPLPFAASANGLADQLGDALTRYADCASTMGLGNNLAARLHSLRRKRAAAFSRGNRGLGALRIAAAGGGLACAPLVLACGAVLAENRAMSLGAALAAALLAARIFMPMRAAVGAWRATRAARDVIARFPATAALPQGRTVLPTARGELVLDSVSWTPAGADHPALRGVTLKIEAGAVLAIIGPSAAGKSTLARVLCGALRPPQGTVRLDGAELAGWGATQLAASIGYLPQEVALYPGTIAENIARFGDATDEQIKAAGRLAGAHDMIERLPGGYATLVEENSAALSGGQRQQVALARALFGDPPVLVLDEPNASLDAEGEAALIACMIEARRRHRTVIMITHSTALVRVADFVATMVGGHIMKLQKTADLLGRPARVAALA